MSLTNDSTTHVCLFHHRDHAKAAYEHLVAAGIPESAISLFGDSNAGEDSSAALNALGVPAKDLQTLQAGIRNGGVVVAVAAISSHENVVERIFEEQKAKKIDEAVTREDLAPVASEPLATAAMGATTIPILEEELLVGTRTVDRGGVRVYQRIVETPVEESIGLREEHVVVSRNPVDRPATTADLSQTSQRIELSETAEEAVVAKTARVVEEVVVSKGVVEHTEHVSDTVRKTEVDVEELRANDRRTGEITAR